MGVMDIGTIYLPFNLPLLFFVLITHFAPFVLFFFEGSLRKLPSIYFVIE